MGYTSCMTLDMTEVTAENESLFRQSLSRAVERYLATPTASASPLFSRTLVETVSLDDVIETVGAVDGIIAQFDMRACIEGGGLYGSSSMAHLARWLVNGGTPEVRELLKPLRDRKGILVWPLADAAVSAEYLDACLKAGITDGQVIARGYADGIAIEFLVPVHA